MLEALEYYQSLAQKFQPQLLTGPGVVITLAGLILWLAGLRWRRVIGAIACAAMACAVAFVIGLGQGFFLPAAAVIGLTAGSVMDKVMLGIFGAILAAGVVLLFCAYEKAEPGVEFYSDKNYDPNKIVAEDFVDQKPYPVWGEYESSDRVITSPEAVEISRQMVSYFVSNAKEGLRLCKTGSFAGAGFAAIIMTVIAMAVPRFYISVMSSTIGTMVIFLGMIMLLFYKGSKPITLIAQQGGFYLAVAGVMVVFGTVVQLLLTPKRHKVIVPKVKENKDGEEK